MATYYSLMQSANISKADAEYLLTLVDDFFNRRYYLRTHSNFNEYGLKNELINVFAEYLDEYDPDEITLNEIVRQVKEKAKCPDDEEYECDYDEEDEEVYE